MTCKLLCPRERKTDIWLILTGHCSLFDLWNPSTANEESDSVLASVTAVGLVGVAQMTRSQIALEAARKSYGKALQLTNAALRDQTEAVKDTTMLSVLILGLFEMIGGSSARTTEAWQKHLNGAAALAKIRGMGQFRSRAGIRMFFMLTQNTMISCIQNELPMRRFLPASRHFGHLANLWFQERKTMCFEHHFTLVCQLANGQIKQPRTSSICAVR